MTAALLLLWAASAAQPSEPICVPEGRAVLLQVGELEGLGPEVAERLRAGLLSRGGTPCGKPGPEEVVQLGVDGGAGLPVRVTLEVPGAELQARALDVGELPPDSRALAVVVAAEELLRTAARPAIYPRPVPLPFRAWATALLLRGDWFSRGHTQQGPELLVAYALCDVWSLRAGLGFRWTPTREVAGVGLGATAWTASAGVSARVAQLGDARLELHAGLDLVRVRYDGLFDGSSAGLGMSAQGGLTAWLPVGRSLRLVSQLNAGMTLRRVRVLADTSVLPSLEGFTASVAAGLAFIP